MRLDLHKILEMRFIIPIICCCIAYIIGKNFYEDFYAWAFMSALIIWAQLNHRIKMNNKIHNLIAIFCFIPCLFLPLMIAYLPLIFFYWERASYLTPEEEEANRQAYERYQAEALNRNLQERLDKLEQASKIQATRVNSGNYGIGAIQLPPGGYKLCRIFAKLHDGTTATFHTIGLEHQVSQLVRNDPRFEWADVSIDDPNEWGRYGVY